MRYKAYLIPIITVLAIGLFVWLFTKVVIYLIIATVLSLLAQPVVKLLSKIKLGKFELPDSIIALLTMTVMGGALFCMFYVFVPVLVDEVRFLSTLNFGDTFAQIVDQFPNFKQVLLSFGSEKEVSDTITTELTNALSFKNAGTIVNGAFSVLGSLLGATLAILFITFFILKDDKLVYRGLLLITPSNYEAEMKDILRTTKTLLSKYFVGLAIDVLIVSLLVSLGMYIFGVKNALLIGIFTGLMNIIPYVGPLMSFLFASFLGITGCIESNQIQEIDNVLQKVFFILLAVNMLDGFILQPYIFSNSVKAHPLEIFLVILMSATLAGVWGMVVAIPAYTLLRIIAKEFLVNFKFFKKLTEDIPE